MIEIDFVSAVGRIIVDHTINEYRDSQSFVFFFLKKIAIIVNTSLLYIYLKFNSDRLLLCMCKYHCYHGLPGSWVSPRVQLEWAKPRN